MEIKLQVKNVPFLCTQMMGVVSIDIAHANLLYMSREVLFNIVV